MSLLPFGFLTVFPVSFFLFLFLLYIKIDITVLNEATHYGSISGFAIEFMYHFFIVLHQQITLNASWNGDCHFTGNL